MSLENDSAIRRGEDETRKIPCFQRIWRHRPAGIVCCNLQLDPRVRDHCDGIARVRCSSPYAVSVAMRRCRSDLGSSKTPQLPNEDSRRHQIEATRPLNGGTLGVVGCVDGCCP